jgi:hypothetical protein
MKGSIGSCRSGERNHFATPKREDSPQEARMPAVLFDTGQL